MGELMGYDDWLQAQNCLLGAALIDPSLVPRVVTELSEGDFSGVYLQVYRIMSKLFRQSKRADDVDPVAVAHALGDSPEARTLVGSLMGCSPVFSEVDRYMETVRQSSKLSRLRELGNALASSVTLDDAEATADGIATQLIDRPALKGFDPNALFDSFDRRHRQREKYLDWAVPAVNDYVRVKRGNLVVIGAEPSGGKTAWALQQLLKFSADKRVLFASLETDADTLFDRFVSFAAGVPMDAMMDGLLTQEQWDKVSQVRGVLQKRTFRFFPAAGLSVAGIKAAAVAYRADIVIIDYLQIISRAGNGSRYEKITEISMDLHVLAQSTGMIVIALSQVTNRDPKMQNSPLTIHSARESGQIEADADIIMMLDKHVEKKLIKSGCNANRILRIVKNKQGRCSNIPLRFDGRTQTFCKANVPNPDWQRVQAAKPKPEKPEFEQLPMDTEVPF